MGGDGINDQNNFTRIFLLQILGFIPGCLRSRRDGAASQEKLHLSSCAISPDQTQPPLPLEILLDLIPLTAPEKCNFMGSDEVLGVEGDLGPSPQSVGLLWDSISALPWMLKALLAGSSSAREHRECLPEVRDEGNSARETFGTSGMPGEQGTAEGPTDPELLQPARLSNHHCQLQFVSKRRLCSLLGSFSWNKAPPQLLAFVGVSECSWINWVCMWSPQSSGAGDESLGSFFCSLGMLYSQKKSSPGLAQGGIPSLEGFPSRGDLVLGDLGLCWECLGSI